MADGANPVEQLMACDLLLWGLQRDPAARPQSCEDVLAHPFFAGLDFMALEKGKVDPP